MHSSKAPEFAAFSAYHDFDFYALHEAIQLHSNIQESEARYREYCTAPAELKQQVLEEALQLDGANVEVLLELLKLDPLKYYEEALTIMPEDSEYLPELHFYLGELLEDMGKDKEAKSYLIKTKDSKDTYFAQKADKVLSKIKSSWW